MCGFTGWFDPNPEPEEVLRKMTSALAHRGPDAEGFYYKPPLALGHRRLAIIDLAASCQPMIFGSHVLAYNGEIYNFQELREELEALGHHFQTKGDTEVVLHAFIEWKEKALSKLQGMFALAYFDGTSLLLARDHFGVKPLYISHCHGKLFFASEIKALLAHPAISRDINCDAIGLYLECQYIPSPLSIFAQIQKLPPASYLLYRQGRLEQHKYWIPTYQPKFCDNEESATAMLIRHLRRSVQSMLIADVPIGVFVSGGLDSSLIAALAQEASGKKTTLFSIDVGEEKYAALVAAHLGAHYHPLFITSANIIQALDDLFDEPLGDQAALPTLLLAKHTKQHVKVVLTGEGADEVFGGYSNYAKRLKEMALCQRFGRFPLPQIYPWLPMKLRKSRLMKAMSRPISRRYTTVASLFDKEMHKSAFTFQSSVALEELAETHFFQCASDEYLDKMLHIDQNLWLSDDLLTKVDRATMTHSLEARVPYLDHHLVEFGAKLPPRLKINGEDRKYLLKKAAKEFLPPEIIDRSKHGFVLPLHSWMQGALKPWIDDALFSLSKRRLFQPHFLTKNHHGTRLFALLSLELWFRKYVPDYRS